MRKNKIRYTAVLCLTSLLLSSCTNMYDPQESDHSPAASSQASQWAESSSQESRWTESSSQESLQESQSPDSSQEGKQPSSGESGGESPASSATASSEQKESTESVPYQDIDGYHAPKNWRSLYPNGSADSLEGTVAVVSIFASEGNHTWNFEEKQDLKTYSTAYYNLKYACEFLEKESAEYGKDTHFIWDWMEHNELYHVAELTADFSDILQNSDIFVETWDYIDNHVNSENIRKKLQADSMIYLVFLNSEEGNLQPSCTRNYYAGMPYPYEICYLQMRNRDGMSVPAVFAHEMLHAFGAPDLYWTSSYSAFSLEYGITKEYTDYVKETRLNDIMRITWDPDTGRYVSNGIVQDITEITAYYVGLIDESDIVREWGFEPSQHVNR